MADADANGKVKPEGAAPKRPRTTWQVGILCLAVGGVSFPILLLNRKLSQSEPPAAPSRSSNDGSDLEAAIVTLTAQLREAKDEVQRLRSSVGLQKEALQRQKDALDKSRGAARRLELDVAALQAPWLGHGGEVQCAADMRCRSYIDAGDKNLAASGSVAACKAYCNRTYPAVPFFAFHNEAGMTLFKDHPKGRCRCSDRLPCELVPDGGYALWSTQDSCASFGRQTRRAGERRRPPGEGAPDGGGSASSASGGPGGSGGVGAAGNATSLRPARATFTPTNAPANAGKAPPQETAVGKGSKG